MLTCSYGELPLKAVMYKHFIVSLTQNVSHIFIKSDQAVLWLGKPVAVPKVLVRIPCKAWMSNYPSLAPLMTERFCAQKLVERKCQVQSPVALVDLTVLSFPWYSP